jgi:hypothetical protein
MIKLKIRDIVEKYGNKNISVMIPKFSKDIETYKNIKMYTTIVCNVRQLRDADSNANYWALLNLAVDNGICEILRMQDGDAEKLLQQENIENLHIYLKWKLLEHKFVPHPKHNSLIEIWDSTSFEKMEDETKFKQYKKQVKQFICETLCISIDNINNYTANYL